MGKLQKPCLVLTVVFMMVGIPMGQEISLRAQHICNEMPNNVMEMTLRVTDISGIAKRMHAVDADTEIINTCSVSGSGSDASPYVVKTQINRNTGGVVNNNDCGMNSTSETGGITVYTWRFKVFAHLESDPYARRGFVLSVACKDDTVEGIVSTIVDYENVQSYQVVAADEESITGLDSIATNSRIQYRAELYPNSEDTNSALRGAEGIYLYNCISATNENMNQNRETFIDENGCPVSGTTFAPTNGFLQQENTGDKILLTAQYATSTVVFGEKTIYTQCSVGICTTENDEFCRNRCLAHQNGETIGPTRRNVGVILSDSFTVQDIHAQEMYPARPGGVPKVLSTNVNSPISIVTQFAPNGIGSNAALSDAKGFYVYGCRYSLSESMADSVTFVDDNGCKVPGTNMEMGDNFFYDSQKSAPNVYIVRSGRIDLDQFTGNNRIWVRCNTGKCIVENHNYCTGTRCNALNNIPSGAENLGDQGLQFTLSMIDPVNVPAINLKVTGPDGEILQTDKPVKVGKKVDFRVEVTPGGQGNGGSAFSTAQGIYIYDCVAKTSDGIEDRFLDGNGCQVQGSNYQLESQCKDETAVKGVEPFVINCGGYTQQTEGDITTECKVGYCTTPNNTYCENRCAAGAIAGQSNAINADLTVTSNYKAEVEDLRRTAIRSEEIDDIITAVTIVAALFVLAVVCIGTYVIIRKQRNRAKRSEDSRSFQY